MYNETKKVLKKGDILFKNSKGFQRLFGSLLLNAYDESGDGIVIKPDLIPESFKITDIIQDEYDITEVIFEGLKFGIKVFQEEELEMLVESKVEISNDEDSLDIKSSSEILTINADIEGLENIEFKVNLSKGSVIGKQTSGDDLEFIIPITVLEPHIKLCSTFTEKDEELFDTSLYSVTFEYVSFNKDALLELSKFL